MEYLDRLEDHEPPNSPRQYKESTADRATLTNYYLVNGQLRKIPRPRNAFMIFASRSRMKFAVKFPNESNSQISKRLGEAWRDLPQQEKDNFFEESRNEGMEHKRRHPYYQYSPKAMKKTRQSYDKPSAPLAVSTHPSSDEFSRRTGSNSASQGATATSSSLSGQSPPSHDGLCIPTASEMLAMVADVTIGAPFHEYDADSDQDEEKQSEDSSDEEIVEKHVYSLRSRTATAPSPRVNVNSSSREAAPDHPEHISQSTGTLPVRRHSGFPRGGARYPCRTGPFGKRVLLLPPRGMTPPSRWPMMPGDSGPNAHYLRSMYYPSEPVDSEVHHRSLAKLYNGYPPPHPRLSQRGRSLNGYEPFRGPMGRYGPVRYPFLTVDADLQDDFCTCGCQEDEDSSSSTSPNFPSAGQDDDSSSQISCEDQLAFEADFKPYDPPARDTFHKDEFDYDASPNTCGQDAIVFKEEQEDIKDYTRDADVNASANFCPQWIDVKREDQEELGCGVVGNEISAALNVLNDLN